MSISRSNGADVGDALFEKFDSFGRGQREHPANQAQVHAVFAVVRRRSGLDDVVRIRNGIRIQRGVTSTDLIS
jgi:hypothetical protein